MTKQKKRIVGEWWCVVNDWADVCFSQANEQACYQWVEIHNKIDKKFSIRSCYRVTKVREVLKRKKRS